jgi:hypothetical protein
VNTDNPSSDERLREELLSLGARPFDLIALGSNPERALAALQQAQGKEHPVAYARKLYDSPEWKPSQGSKRQGVNLHADEAPPMPPVQRERNLAEARKILAMLKGEK